MNRDVTFAGEDGLVKLIIGWYGCEVELLFDFILRLCVKDRLGRYLIYLMMNSDILICHKLISYVMPSHSL